MDTESRIGLLWEAILELPNHDPSLRTDDVVTISAHDWQTAEFCMIGTLMECQSCEAFGILQSLDVSAKYLEWRICFSNRMSRRED